MNKFSIPGYRINERVGVGGFGEVYRITEDKENGVNFAVKILNQQPMLGGEFSKQADRLDREIQTIKHLSHKGIVRYMDTGFTLGERYPYILMEYIKGKNLIEYSTDLSITDKINLVIELLNAIGYMHEQQVIHRDIKPKNILIKESDSQPVLIDFGLLYAFGDETITKSNSMMGTLAYMHPELSMNPRARDPRHDLYSLGITLFEIITGKVTNCIEYPKKSIATLLEDDTYSKIDKVLAKVITIQTDEIYENAHEFKTALLSLDEPDSKRNEIREIMNSLRKKIDGSSKLMRKSMQTTFSIVQQAIIPLFQYILTETEDVKLFFDSAKTEFKIEYVIIVEGETENVEEKKKLTSLQELRSFLELEQFSPSYQILIDRILLNRNWIDFKKLVEGQHKNCSLTITVEFLETTYKVYQSTTYHGETEFFEYKDAEFSNRLSKQTEELHYALVKYLRSLSEMDS